MKQEIEGGTLNRRTALKGTAAASFGFVVAGTSLSRLSGVSAQDDASPEAMSEPEVLIGDVVDFALDGDWEGHFGSVTFKMHRAYYDGEEAWFIRTDASDQEYAEQQELVYVPLLANALKAEGSYAEIYFFDGGMDDQHSVISTIPGNDDFTTAFHVNAVSFTGDAETLMSVDDITAAADAGSIEINETGIVVNHPLVAWPGGGLPVDPDLASTLAPGPLMAEPDAEAGTVMFKLHECYPESRYIITDTSAVPMAEAMMGIVGSAPTQLLIEAGATAPIYVFGNGLPGGAAMGGQPSIFNAKAGDVIWSPFWEHFTVTWNDGAEPVVLTTEAEVFAQEEAGNITIHPGTPDTEESFVVNCPSAVLAANTYDPADFGG